MNQSIILLSTLLWTFVSSQTSAETPNPTLSGPNVCSETSSVTEEITVRYEKEFSYRVTEHCWDISKAFKCDVIKTGTKTAYRKEPVEKNKVRQLCCKGFVEEDSETGDVKRCVEEKAPNPQPLKEAGPESASFGAGGIVGVVLAAVVLVCLVAAVLYYRRKYRSEKDPAYPTVTYATEEGLKKGWENNEFDNPMFAAQGSRESTYAAYAPGPLPSGKISSEPVYAEANETLGSTSVHYESPSFSSASTSSPYDTIPPLKKLAY